MARKAPLITSRSKKGMQAVRLFEDAYNKAGLDTVRAQMLNEKGGELQDGVLALIRRLAPEPEKAHMLVIDRSIQFDPVKFIGQGWSIWCGSVDGNGLEGELDQDERMLALAEIDPEKLVFSTHLKSEEIWITGEEKLKREKSSGVLRLDTRILQALVEESGQKSLKLIRAKGITWLEGLGTILRHPDGYRCALCLCADGLDWDWSFIWLDDERGEDSPSGSLAQ